MLLYKLIRSLVDDLTSHFFLELLAHVETVFITQALSLLYLGRKRGCIFPNNPFSFFHSRSHVTLLKFEELTEYEEFLRAAILYARELALVSTNRDLTTGVLSGGKQHYGVLLLGKFIDRL